MTGASAGQSGPGTPSRVVVGTALAYAQALVPHLEHEVYRCDRPRERLMGKGCRSCDVETLIALDDFRRTGDLPVFEAALKPHAKKGQR